ncbi:uncharacterized protein LAESUDRAFT_287510 [Laetiporus sulphureus 93-53]|uniref:Uncharacterized protein n=1 Tax=Laetiporus sulphureus 93-53 TaxID=1314785 RepID=A0A165DCY5_9APHY|nr:uncharacterized protein LAESUDRAFT_287510 [Laetiporus sulphureus 93-53]KZT04591.1 hypothetical protein LAESUDRAFT_287510 [Laetiporus sulphureus 93-53]
MMPPSLKRTAGTLARLARDDEVRTVPFSLSASRSRLHATPRRTEPTPSGLVRSLDAPVLELMHRMSDFEPYQLTSSACFCQNPSIIYIEHSFSCSTPRRHECAGSFKISSAGTSSAAALSITTFAHLKRAAALAVCQRTITRSEFDLLRIRYDGQLCETHFVGTCTCSLA